MILISVTLGSISLILLCLACFFWWARHRIVNHPCVEHINVAHPTISKEITILVDHVASIANVPVPNVYIFRAELPNAFIIPGRRSPKLFIADELLESCNQPGFVGLQELELAICHEVAHLVRRDALILGIIELFSLIGCALNLKFLINKSNAWRHQIENKTHDLGASFYIELQANN